MQRFFCCVKSKKKTPVAAPDAAQEKQQKLDRIREALLNKLNETEKMINEMATESLSSESKILLQQKILATRENIVTSAKQEVIKENFEDLIDTFNRIKKMTLNENQAVIDEVKRTAGNPSVIDEVLLVDQQPAGTRHKP